MDWIIRVVIFISFFMLWRKVLLMMDSELSAAQTKHKIVLVVAMVYLVCVSCNASFPWEGIFWASIAVAAYSDYITREIYDFVYIPAVIVCILQLLSSTIPRKIIIELIVFCYFQLFVCRLLYGFSDCIAFCVCAMYLTVCGGGIIEYMNLMILSYMLVFIVQLFKGNINCKGNLKSTVAFIPYIAASMLLYLQIK